MVEQRLALCWTAQPILPQRISSRWQIGCSLHSAPRHLRQTARLSDDAMAYSGWIEEEEIMAGVTYTRTGKFAHIRMNAPGGNAFTPDLRRELNAAFVQYRDDEEAWAAV